MVLGAQLMRISLLSALVLVSPLSACANGSLSETEEFTVSGHRLELERDQCVLSVLGADSTQSTLKLEMKPPCFFSRSEGEIQTYAFEDVGVDSVLIVVGTPVPNDDIDKWNLSDKEAQRCGAQHQGVVISESTVALSQRVSTGGVACRDYGIDQKEFWMYAHDQN